MSITHKQRCLEVSVKFVRPGHSGTHIRLSMADTRAQFIEITHDSVRLHLAFLTKEGHCCKTISFNANEVLEYECSGIVPMEFRNE